jgi:hypothetical protein
MALCRRVKRFSSMAIGQLYTWSIERQAIAVRSHPDQLPQEILARLHLFYFGGGIVEKEIKVRCTPQAEVIKGKGLG